jgi:hypothetical protein
MKIDIIVVYVQRYERGHELDFVPPITGIHLAGITPAQYDARDEPYSAIRSRMAYASS